MKKTEIIELVTKQIHDCLESGIYTAHTKAVRANLPNINFIKRNGKTVLAGTRYFSEGKIAERAKEQGVLTFTVTHHGNTDEYIFIDKWEYIVNEYLKSTNERIQEIEQELKTINQ